MHSGFGLWIISLNLFTITSTCGHDHKKTGNKNVSGGMSAVTSVLLVRHLSGSAQTAH